jgi:hypothetical protein
MKTTVKSMPCLRITVHRTRNGVKISESKTVRKASAAAKFYTLCKNTEWWDTYSQVAPVGYVRYIQMDARYDRLYRRTLRVFKQYLP